MSKTVRTMKRPTQRSTTASRRAAKMTKYLHMGGTLNMGRNAAKRKKRAEQKQLRALLRGCK